jgi:hypothetical protein
MSGLSPAVYPGNLEQIQSSRAVAKIVQGAVSLRKTALVCFEPLYTYSELAISFAILCFCLLTEFIVRRKREILRREAGNPEPQIPFDYAQGRLSTPMGAKDAPVSAQDDRRCSMNSRLRTLYP